MTDRLTQLQNCLDDFLTQMYASLRYIDTHHAYAPIPGQSDQNPFASSAPNTQGTQSTAPSMQNPATPAQPAPDPPALFEARLQELAQDLVLKEQQIEALVEALPGVGCSQAEQEARLRALEEELKAVDVEWKEAKRERERLVEKVEGVILGVRRI
ncbi:hypothetical protein EJ06DRAFT_529127 [Trichodelitschia bisporula]|uniref:Mediator of RNA polymerase II transcription subunit 21 n=1 Tax=Trichodelitschia bisporula TaxID=703511 RepID=A0A6G1I1P2_9PEZI|nr:hypothetical protein EJ06DRAFT_529127 [Trichodelitschia bisporula]